VSERATLNESVNAENDEGCKRDNSFEECDSIILSKLKSCVNLFQICIRKAVLFFCCCSAGMICFCAFPPLTICMLLSFILSGAGGAAKEGPGER